MSTSTSTRSPCSAACTAAWSLRSAVIVRTPEGSRSGWRPRLRTATSWPLRSSARTRWRLMNSVPPTTRTRTSADSHGDAGGGPRHAVDDPDTVGDQPAYRVQAWPLDDGDEVIRAGDAIELHHGSGTALDPGQGLLHRLGLTGGRLDEHVGLHPLGSRLHDLSRRAAMRTLAAWA